MYKSGHIKKLYNGYYATKVIWNHTLNGLKQLEIPENRNTNFNRLIPRKLRLGQLAEQFVFNQLEQLEACNILAENIQIKKEKQTIGELDALIEFENKQIHLEIVYKFYLHDSSLGTSEVKQWIGPNRNDSLIEKITKLKNKQLPLLYSSECKSTLDKLNLNPKKFQQSVCFKAQLFTPYQKSINFNQLNEACVCGFYINKSQLNEFEACEFYIPQKLDWFLDVQKSVEWLGFEALKIEAEVFLMQSKSPLIWIKKPDNTLLKCFLVWW